MRYVDKSIPDRSRPRLPTGQVSHGTCGNYATVKTSGEREEEGE